MVAVHSPFRWLGRLFAQQGRRRRLLPAALIFAITAASPLALADVIYLKTGRQIVARVTHMDAKQVYYERGGAESSVPWSQVERIDSFAPPPGESTLSENSGGATQPRSLPRGPAIGLPPQALSPVIKDDAIDEAYLQRLDNEVLRNPSVANRHRLAQGYQAAAYFLTDKGDPGAAIERCRHALELAPEDLGLTLSLAFLLVAQNRQDEAIELLLTASNRNPRSPDVHFLLGWAYYSSENLDRTIAEWKKALAIRDDPRIRESLTRIEKEQSVAGSYKNLQSTHFLLRIEGGKGGALGKEVLSTLETAFRHLQTELDLSPSETIVVLLYPNQDFRDITHSPSWVDGLNDGKIRVPVSGLSTMTPELARVLKHELTHSFIRQATLGRCPTWFNEGLAQLEDGATTLRYGKQLARVFARTPKYSALEGSFMDLPANGAGLVYAKSLAGIEYLRDTYGLGEIRQLLKAMAGNPDFDALLQLELRLTYPTFEQDVATYLEKRYGRP